MKNNDIHNDKSQKADERLADMLHAIEHAGRDKRRQQQLSSLIDHLAAEEAVAVNRRHRRLWTTVFSAAACIALFVTTIVRLTNTTATIPPAGGPLLANVVNDTLSVNNENRDTMQETPQRAVKKTEPIMVASNEVGIEEPSLETEETLSIEDTVTDITEPEEFLAEETEDFEEDAEEKTEPVETIATPIVSVGNNEKVTAQEEQEPAKKSRRLISLRRPEPSKMEGTMLALRIL